MMKTIQLLETLEFHDKNPYAEPLHIAKTGRILRFTLKPGQEVVEHSAPDSPVYLVVLQGHGYFTGGEGEEAQIGPNSLLIFEPGEKHSIRTEVEALVFVAFLHGASNWQ
jgi:quercetin dioxygenase-like cupin family protein